MFYRISFWPQNFEAAYGAADLTRQCSLRPKNLIRAPQLSELLNLLTHAEHGITLFSYIDFSFALNTQPNTNISVMTTLTILDLPVELLHSIFSYLEVDSFLNLTSTCKALHNPDFLHDSKYWSTLVRTTFRVPNQPVVEQDGQRWQKLFKRLLTQSRIYTWGNNEKACLGHSFESPSSLQSAGPPATRRAHALRRRHISWPEKMRREEDLGVISDLQCGGWSTTLLTAKGALYTVGVIDGLQVQRQPPHVQKVMVEPVPLRYPPGFPHPYDRYDASTAVKQFSSGRAHVLALSDSGRIWSWQNIEHAALHVRFILHDTVENGRSSGKGVVKKVVAGWNKSAALIAGTGIVVWEPLQRGNDETAIEDAALVLESALVPKTSFVTSNNTVSSHFQTHTPSSAEEVGEVCNFIVLEGVILFNTDLGKMFVAQIFWTNRDQSVGEPVEIHMPESEKRGRLVRDGRTRLIPILWRLHSIRKSTHKQTRPPRGLPAGPTQGPKTVYSHSGTPTQRCDPASLRRLPLPCPSLSRSHYKLRHRTSELWRSWLRRSGRHRRPVTRH